MNDWSDAEQHVERAHELYEASRWEEAESELRRALALNPYRAEWHFNLGLTLEAAGRFEEAVCAYSDARALEPASQQTLLALGMNHLRLEDPAAALTFLKEAHQLEPMRPDALVHLIDAHAALGDHEEAELAFYLAVQLEGVDKALALTNLAGSLMDRSVYEKAVWCLREAAQIDPQLPRVHARLAEAHAECGRKERARQLYLRELRNNPGDIDTLLDLGCLLIEMNRLGEAGEKFRRALELESDNPEAHFYLGELALRQRRETQALASFRLVLRLDPEHSGARCGAARILLDQDQREEARRLLRRELRMFRRDKESYEPEELDDFGALLLDAEMFSDAALVLKDLVAREPENAAARRRLALICFRMGDRAAGIAECRKALRLEPGDVAAMHNIALAYVEQGQWARARCWVRRALAVDPEDASLRRLRVKLRSRAARSAFRRAISTIFRGERG